MHTREDLEKENRELRDKISRLESQATEARHQPRLHMKVHSILKRPDVQSMMTNPTVQNMEAISALVAEAVAAHGKED